MKYLLCSGLVFGLGLLAVRAEPAKVVRPAVLFCGGLHNQYVARPLQALGIELDQCSEKDLADRLASGKYNVVVVATLTPANLKVLEGFLAKGGGVMSCSSDSYPREKDWLATCEWLTAAGARPRWEMLQDNSSSNVVRDVMGCQLTWTSDIAEPFNRGVKGVLTLLANSTTGWEPPMPWDLAPDWKVVVRAASSVRTVIDKRNDVSLVPWIPAQGLPSAPPLLAVREQAKGRLAVMAIRYYWVFSPPMNCPTTEAMLTAGAGGKESHWLQVFANTFRWLAEPSLQAGLGGAVTPEKLLNPPPDVWALTPVVDWAAQDAIPQWHDQLQVPGLIGARTELSSGTGTVAQYVAEARQAGLKFIVFMEDSLKMDQAKWDQLVAQCTAASSPDFLAVPGLTYEDAQGDHLYAFADEVKFPKPAMLLPDQRLATVQEMRSRAYFDYDNEYLGQHAIRGFWNHRNNYLHWADYKLYNSFPIYSFADGKPIDSALPEFLHLQGIGGCQSAVAFEFMSSPAQVSARARDGWRVVSTRPLSALNGKWHDGAYSFSGGPAQYISNGPEILLWDGPNRLAWPNGQWWRPDQWEFRVRLKVASAAGLKSVTLYDGDRGVFRRWLPTGQKTFQEELVLANCQQLGLTLVVEDLNGRQAVSMSFWNRNLVKEEFFCSDRCNFLGNSRLRSRTGSQTWTPVGFTANMGITPSKGLLDMSVTPAVSLTLNSPTLPVDGAPAGFPTVHLNFSLQIPGEAKAIFGYSQTHIVSPEIGIGQADYKLAYDPAEEDAKVTPLGHAYTGKQHGQGNAWGSWHHLVPTFKAEGHLRTYAGNWIPGEFRIGWHEADLTFKDAVTPDPKIGGIQVMYPSMSKWLIYRDGNCIAGTNSAAASIPFTRGTLGVLVHAGGCALVIPLDGPLVLDYAHDGSYRLKWVPTKPEIAKGDRLQYRVAFAGASGQTTDLHQLLEFAGNFGLAKLGSVGYSPKITLGKQLDNCLIWQLDGQGVGIAATVPKVKLNGLLTTVVQGLNDNWSVQLLDKQRPWPNHRALPIRDGKAYAALDLFENDMDLFIGHPVTADHPEIKLSVAWKSPGVWSVEAHNPTDKPITAALVSPREWSLFHFKETVTLTPGSSQFWDVKQNGN